MNTEQVAEGKRRVDEAVGVVAGPSRPSRKEQEAAQKEEEEEEKRRRRVSLGLGQCLGLKR